MDLFVLIFLLLLGLTVLAMAVRIVPEYRRLARRLGVAELLAGHAQHAAGVEADAGENDQGDQPEGSHQHGPGVAGHTALPPEETELMHGHPDEQVIHVAESPETEVTHQKVD